MNDFANPDYDAMYAAIEHNMQTVRQLMAQAEEIAAAALQTSDAALRSSLKAQVQQVHGSAAQLMQQTEYMLQHYAATVQANGH